MRRSFLCLTIIFLSFSFNSLHAEAAEPPDAIMSYFEALKSGDTETMKHYMAGEYYERYRVLLEKNKSYPEFLRNFYKGSQLQIGDYIKAGNDAVMRVEIYFPDGSTSVSKFRLKKYDDGWKTVEEINNFN